MFSNNCVHIVGNIGSPPETRFFESGAVLTQFSVAVSAGKDRDPNWVDCQAWNQSAERAQRLLAKGRRCALSGALKQEAWKAKDGGNRSRLVVNVESIEIIDKAPALSPTVQPVLAHNDDGEFDDIPF